MYELSGDRRRYFTDSIKRQAELLNIPRGSAYSVPRTASEVDQRLMRRIDELHLEHPFAGSRMLRDMLQREGFKVGGMHAGTLTAKISIQALYRKPNTSKKHPGHAVYPYLLRGKKIDRANEVWAMDITYIPIAKGWVYLAAVVVLADDGAPVMLAPRGDGAAVFVLGSAVPHPHDLHLGCYSVHASAEGLATGEQRITQLGEKLKSAGDRTVPIYR